MSDSSGTRGREGTRTGASYEVSSVVKKGECSSLEGMVTVLNAGAARGGNSGHLGLGPEWLGAITEGGTTCT